MVYRHGHEMNDGLRCSRCGISAHRLAPSCPGEPPLVRSTGFVSAPLSDADMLKAGQHINDLSARAAAHVRPERESLYEECLATQGTQFPSASDIHRRLTSDPATPSDSGHTAEWHLRRARNPEDPWSIQNFGWLESILEADGYTDGFIERVKEQAAFHTMRMYKEAAEAEVATLKAENQRLTVLHRDAEDRARRIRHDLLRTPTIAGVLSRRGNVNYMIPVISVTSTLDGLEIVVSDLPAPAPPSPPPETRAFPSRALAQHAQQTGVRTP